MKKRKKQKEQIQESIQLKPKTNKNKNISEILRVKRKKVIKLNKIYEEKDVFYIINKNSGFISKWTKEKEKIPFDEALYIIIDHFPTEEEYYKLYGGIV